MKLTREQVLHVAKLARLELSEAEVETFSRQLSAILGYVEQLEALDTSAVEPTFHVVPMATPMRPDEPAASIPVEEALANAPARIGSAFAVPKVIEG
jgi:aspartyl-tRNA(Asn)/glutamyl-tRNA(Gln) amidotransferase subunit C